MEIINFKKKKLKLLTNEQQKSYQNKTINYISEEKFEDKLGIIAIIQVIIEVICNTTYVIQSLVYLTRSL